MEMSGQLHAPAALLLVKRLDIHWIGGWVGHRAGLDAVAQRNIPSRYRKSNPGRPACSLVATSANE
jgi:hypothetical protein